ncbi:hypothetical protein HJFPF1_04530 [Paramyrothecium foliicola]|nr:hypothetical protein HJFPF1_04530 [Paramyrothecium foliicola]
MEKLSSLFSTLKPPVKSDEEGSNSKSISPSPSFSSLRTSIRRSVKVASKQFSVVDGLCRQCRAIDPQKAFDEATALGHSTNGIDGFLILERPPDSFEPSCRICAIFTEQSTTTQLRAFPLPPFFERQLQAPLNRSLGETPSRSLPTSDYFLASVPKGLVKRRDCDKEIDLLVSNSGFLLWRTQSWSAQFPVEARQVPRRFNADIVKDWLSECQKAHAACLRHEVPRHLGRLIDCSTRRVVSLTSLDTVPEYVALSYVWGNRVTASGKSDQELNGTPRVVEDALLVAKILGYQYLWVDKYCVDQDDNSAKHEQIMNMDSVYENAALTIIATAGTDHHHGLAGVSSDRRKKNIPFQHDNFPLSWIPPAPHKEILESHWMTRGWTYQEAVLSRRRLVFTDRQVYFECCSMACYESLRVTIETSSVEQPSWVNAFRLPYLFTLPRFGTATLISAASQQLDHAAQKEHDAQTWKTDIFNAYTRSVEGYSHRTLTYDSDSLNAFGGMIKRFESSVHGPLRHLWGIPFFDPRDDKLPSDVVDYVGFLLAGLCWRHETGAVPPQRRKAFPSWSWTGWKGAVKWPVVADTFEVRAPDFYTLASVQLSFEDGSTRSIPDVRDHRPSGERLGQYPKALLLQTSAISGKDFSFLTLNQSSRLTWYPSEAGIDESMMIQEIRAGNLKALRLGTIGESGFLLVVKKKRGSFHRVGLIQVPSTVVTDRVWENSAYTFKLK